MHQYSPYVWEVILGLELFGWTIMKIFRLIYMKKVSLVFILDDV